MAKRSGLFDGKVGATPYGIQRFGSEGDATNYDPLSIGMDEPVEAVPLKEIVLVDVDSIEFPELAPRTVYTDDMVEDRAKSMDDLGQQEAIKVRPKPGAPGRYFIVEGWTRVLAKRKRGERQILAEIRTDLNDVEAGWLGFHHNEQRAPHLDIDRGLFFCKMMRADATLTQADMADKSKIDRQIIQRLLSFGKLSEELLGFCREHATYFTYNLAYHLARVQDRIGEGEALELARRAVRKSYNQKRFVVEADALLGERIVIQTVKPLAEKPYRGGGLKRYADRVEFNLKCSGDKAEELFAKIDALLAEFDENS